MCAVLTPNSYEAQISLKNVPVYIPMLSDFIIHTTTLWLLNILYPLIIAVKFSFYILLIYYGKQMFKFSHLCNQGLV